MSALPRPATGLLERWNLGIVLYALLSLIPIRILPVAVCLFGTRPHAASVLFAEKRGTVGLATRVGSAKLADEVQ